MTWYPGALKREIPEDLTQPSIRPTQVILHISASESLSLFYLWESPGENLESHFYSPRVNQLEQYMSTTVMADANYLANRRPDGTGAISVETQGADADTGEWNPKQQDDIVHLLVWAHLTHGIPLRICQSPDDPGIGWHVMWGAPGAWTPVSKTCPGPGRIRQIPGLIERAQDIVNGKDDQDMTPEQYVNLFTAAGSPVRKAVWELSVRAVNAALGADPDHTKNDILAVGPGSPARVGVDNLIESSAAVAALRTQVTALANALPNAIAAEVVATVSNLPAVTASPIDQEALTEAVAKAAADEIAKRLAA